MPTLPTITVFSGSQGLTSTLTAAGAAFGFGASEYTIPAGKVAQYRVRATLSGLTNYDHTDVLFQAATGPRYRFGVTRPDRIPDTSGNEWHASKTKDAGVTQTATFLGYGTYCAALDGTAPGLANDTTCIAAGALALTDPGTVEMAFQRTRTGTTEVLFCNWGDGGTNGGQYIVYLDGSGHLNCAWYNAAGSVSNIAGSTAVGTGGAHWAAVSYDGTTLRLYLDGVSQATSTTTLGHGPFPGPSLIGRSWQPSYNTFIGKVDQCRVSNVARYTGGSYTVPAAAFTVDANTVCYLDFEAGAGLTEMLTPWFPMPAGTDTFTCKVRNRAGSSGTVTAVTIEARTVANTYVTQPVLASTPFVVRGGAGQEDDSDCAAPYVFLDTPNTRWVTGYSGYSNTSSSWTLCLAYVNYDAGGSLLGIEDAWSKEAANPVFGPNGGSDGSLIAANGSVELLGSTYYHFYNPSSFSMRLATASSLTGTWTRQASGGDVLTGFDTTGADPQIVVRDGAFAGMYMDRCGTFATREFWFATSPDGRYWNRTRVIGPMDWWESQGEPGPVWYDAGDGERLWFTFDMSTGGGEGRSIGLAGTTDGTAWGLHGYFLTFDAGSAWASAQVFDSCPRLLANGKIAMVHAGAPLGSNVNMDADLGVTYWQAAEDAPTFKSAFAAYSNPPVPAGPFSGVF